MAGLVKNHLRSSGGCWPGLRGALVLTILFAGTDFLRYELPIVDVNL